MRLLLQGRTKHGPDHEPGQSGRQPTSAPHFTRLSGTCNLSRDCPGVNACCNAVTDTLITARDLGLDGELDESILIMLPAAHRDDRDCIAPCGIFTVFSRTTVTIAVKTPSTAVLSLLRTSRSPLGPAPISYSSMAKGTPMQ